MDWKREDDIQAEVDWLCDTVRSTVPLAEVIMSSAFLRFQADRMQARMETLYGEHLAAAIAAYSAASQTSSPSSIIQALNSPSDSSS